MTDELSAETRHELQRINAQLVWAEFAEKARSYDAIAAACLQQELEMFNEISARIELRNEIIKSAALIGQLWKQIPADEPDSHAIWWAAKSGAMWATEFLGGDSGDDLPFPIMWFENVASKGADDSGPVLPHPSVGHKLDGFVVPRAVNKSGAIAICSELTDPLRAFVVAAHEVAHIGDGRDEAGALRFEPTATLEYYRRIQQNGGHL